MDRKIIHMGIAMKAEIEYARECRHAARLHEREIAAILLSLSRKRFLSPKEFAILKYRYTETATLEQLAKKFGVSRERIRQIEEKALYRIMHGLVEEKAAPKSG